MNSDSWRQLKTTLVKHGKDRFEESLPALFEIRSILLGFYGKLDGISPEVDNKDLSTEAHNIVHELVVPVAKILVNLSLTRQELLDTLVVVAKVCSKAWVALNDPSKLLQTLLLITDASKSIFKNETPEDKNPAVKGPCEKEIDQALGNLSQDAPEQIATQVATSSQAIMGVSGTNVQDLARSQNTYYLMIVEQCSHLLENFPLNIFSDQKVPPESVDIFLQVVYNCVKFLEPEYYKKLMLVTISPNVKLYFTTSNESTIRNTTKELLETVKNNIDKLLYLIKDFYRDNFIEWLQRFSVESTLPLIKSDQLSKKLIGAKLLSGFTTDIHLSTFKKIKDQEHKLWLANNRIMQLLFSIDEHEQVIQNAMDVPKFFFRNGGFEQGEIKMILDLFQKRDLNVRKSIMKMFYEVSMRFKSAENAMVLGLLQKCPPAQYFDDMVEVLYDVSKYSISAHRKQGLNLLWRVLLEGFDQHPTHLQSKIVNRYVDLLRTALDRGDITDPQTYLTLVTSAFENRSSSQALKCTLMTMVAKILYLFPATQSEVRFNYMKRTERQMLVFLVEQNGYHQKLLRVIKGVDNQGAPVKYSRGIVNEAVESLTYIVREYKDKKDYQLMKMYAEQFDQNSKPVEYLGASIIHSLLGFPKAFSSLINYYKQSTIQLFEQALANKENFQNINIVRTLKQLFISMNKERIIAVVHENVKRYEICGCIPEELNGYEKLFSIVLQTQSEEVREEAASFIASLYSAVKAEDSKRKETLKNFVNQLLERVNKVYQDESISEQIRDRSILGYYSIFLELMNETETKGVGILKPHGSLVNTESVRIKIVNEFLVGYEIPRIYQTTKFPSNLTLFELLKQASKTFKCSVADILLKFEEHEIAQTNYGRTVEELNLNGLTLTASKRPVEQIPKAKLILENDQLNPLFLKALKEIFQKYSPSGKMVPVEIAKFVEGSTNDYCPVDDSRVTEMLDKYDTDKDGVITLNDFIAFYHDSCRTRETTVWKNLQIQRYRSDLQKYQDIQENTDIESMARFIFHSRPQAYTILFGLSSSSNELVRSKVINLLKRLPTAPFVIQSILGKGTMFQENSLTNNSEFVIWYKLTLMEFMLNLPTDQTEVEKSHQIFAKYLYQINTWRDSFVNSDNLTQVKTLADHLASNETVEQMSSFNRQCFATCLKIMRNLTRLPSLSSTLSTLSQTPLAQLQSTCILENTVLIESLLPQLYNKMVTQLFEPTLCLLYIANKTNLDIVSQGLFHADSEARLICNNYLYLLARKPQFPLKAIFDIQPSKQCKEFFAVLNYIVKQHPAIDTAQLFNTTYGWLKLNDLSKVEPLHLQGKLSLLDTLITLQPDFAKNVEFQVVLLDCLQISFITTESRSLLYDLLGKTDPAPLIVYLNKFLDVFEKAAPRSQILSSYSSNSSKRNKYVGIYNLGCICYMNSVLQQLFMCDDFRWAIMGIKEDPEALKVVQSPQNNRQKITYVDSPVEQLKLMFSFLMLSNRADYNPEAFCYAFRRDINIGVQEDAQEFFNTLFDKLQNHIKNSCFAKIIDQVFGGDTLITIECQQCLKPKYRIEGMRSLLLEVKDRPDIEASLQKLVEKESISDYYCDSCEKKVNVTKQTHLHKLPNTLFIQMQRIVFDIQTLERGKLHSRWEFPLTLDLAKYLKSKEGERVAEAEDTDTNYHLKGVVIHSGNAESGHYFSLIKDENGQWYRFDDSRVSEFNISSLADECYGGKQEQSEWACEAKNSSRSKNAYILVYEKNVKRSLKVDVSDEERLQEAEQSVNLKPHDQQERQTDNTKLIEEQMAKPQQQNGDDTSSGAGSDQAVAKDSCIISFKKTISDKYRQAIEQDAKALEYEVQFSEKGFSKFVRQLLTEQSAVPKEVLKEIQQNARGKYFSAVAPENVEFYDNVARLAFRLLTLFSKLSFVEDAIIKDLTTCYINICFYLPHVACDFIINLDTKQFLEKVSSHSDSTIREHYRIILNKIIDIAIAKLNLNLAAEPDVSNPSSFEIHKKILYILDQFLSLLHTQIPKNRGKMYQYFQFWNVLAQNSNLSVLQFVRQKNIPALFLDFLMLKESPIKLAPAQVIKKLSENKYINPPAGPTLQLILQIFLRLPAQKLSEQEQMCLSSLKFYRLMIQQKQEFSALSSILARMCRGRKQLSEIVAAFILRGINQASIYETALPFIMLIKQFLLVEDKYSRDRVIWVFGVPQLVEGVNFDFSTKKNTTLSQMLDNIKYVSVLGTDKNFRPVLELLYMQRKSIDDFSVLAVETLLSVLANGAVALDYIKDLPPPNPSYQTYIDWIDVFLQSFITEKWIIYSKDKQKTHAECSALLKSVRTKLAGADTDTNPTRHPYLNHLGRTVQIQTMHNSHSVAEEENGFTKIYQIQLKLITCEPEQEATQIDPSAQQASEETELVVTPEMPSIVVVQVSSVNCNLMLTFKNNPFFNYSFYLEGGQQHKLNVPYYPDVPLEDQFSIQIVDSAPYKQVEEVKATSITSSGGDVGSQTISGPYSLMSDKPSSAYYGPYMPGMGPSDASFHTFSETPKEIACPSCTFNNVGCFLNICEMCGSPLPA